MCRRSSVVLIHITWDLVEFVVIIFANIYVNGIVLIRKYSD